jgi:hypothetical protein
LGRPARADAAEPVMDASLGRIRTVAGVTTERFSQVDR